MSTDPQTASVEERVARHLAAKDYPATDGGWDAATSAFRAAYLADARQVLAIVRAAVPSAPVDRAAVEPQS